MYDGVINVYKERGFTSFDVVAKLRGILKQKKIGHTGTLDPDAEGVLVICLGKATKLCEWLTDKDKTYEAEMILGRTTDTEDSTGKVISEKEVEVTEEQVREAVSSYVGEYDQVPPMYSAIKVNGKKLYELAREGIEIERKPRRVVIHEIDILSVSLPSVAIRVSCGKGTYIRSLCRDIGEDLGCGAVMNRLIRSSVNAAETGKVFSLEDALTLGQIEELVRKNVFREYVLPIDTLFPNLEKLRVSEQGIKKLYNGNLLRDSDIAGKSGLAAKNGEKYLMYDRENRFIAIYRYCSDLRGWKADKMFL
ncbi:MAG: tRNA pseudouridine(55) synthase TruB [Bacteroidales bacterium]|nr:tRNA pseudouridine(55) synthase TruB [Clostridium sp.]MCM1203065.1 tRNA pseudouridine(55) synthase TruB [Bacteroidales bacterium]